MKTKNLVTAIALPALFAACTAEDVATVNNNVLKDDLSSRPVVENVILGLGEAESRATKGEDYSQIVYGAGDRVGALLVDQAADLSNTNPLLRYNVLTNTYNTNYIFSTQDGQNFASEAYMVEGNYVFYFPYNEQRTRGAVWTNLPASQKLELQEDGTYNSFADVLAQSEEAGAPMLLGYDFIKTSDADKTINAAMKQIYATPLITIHNGYEVEQGKDMVPAPITITEIVIKKAEGDFVLSAPLKFAATADQNVFAHANNSAGKSIVNVLYNEGIPAANVTTHSVGAWVPASITSESVARKTTDVVDANASGAVKGNEIVLTLDKPIEVEAEGSFSFYAVIPADEYTSGDLQVYVTNELGYYSEAIEMGEATLFPGRRYPIEEYDAQGLNDDLKGTALSGTVTEFDDSGVRVASVDELISAIKNHKTADALNLRVAGTAVINKRVADFLKATTTKAASIEFLNDVKIEGTGVTLEPAKKIVFKNVTAVEGANVTLNSENIKADGLTVAADATVIYKESAIEEIVNNGTLTVKGDVTSEVTNYGAISVEENAEFDNAIENGKSDATKAGTIAVKAGKTLTAAINNYRTSTINNAGTIVGNVANYGEINNGAADNLTAMINASTDGKNNGYNAAAQYTPVVNNYGKVYFAQNNGQVNMLNVNAVLSTTSSSNGTVVNDVLAKVDAKGNTVTYTISGTKDETFDAGTLVDNKITKLIMNGVTWNLSGDLKLKNLDVHVSANTTFYSTKGASVSVQVILGTTTEEVALTVASRKTLTINAGIILCGNYTEEGTIVVNGSKTHLTEFELVGGTASSVNGGLENGGSVLLNSDVNAESAIVISGGELDGGGHTIDYTGTTTTAWPNAYGVTLNNGGSTVKNLTVINAGYAIGSTEATENIYIDNVTTDYVTYAINGNGGGTNSVYVTNSTINGWNSYSNIELFSFENCKLAKGNSYDGYLVVYGDTSFKNCSFEDFSMCARSDNNGVIAAGKYVTFTNCSYEGEKVTASNFKTLFMAEGDETDFNNLAECNVVVDNVPVEWN